MTSEYIRYMAGGAVAWLIKAVDTNTRGSEYKPQFDQLKNAIILEFKLKITYVNYVTAHVIEIE